MPPAHRPTALPILHGRARVDMPVGRARRHADGHTNYSLPTSLPSKGPSAPRALRPGKRAEVFPCYRLPCLPRAAKRPDINLTSLRKLAARDETQRSCNRVRQVKEYQLCTCGRLQYVYQASTCRKFIVRSQSSGCVCHCTVCCTVQPEILV